MKEKNIIRPTIADVLEEVRKREEFPFHTDLDFQPLLEWGQQNESKILVPISEFEKLIQELQPHIKELSSTSFGMPDDQELAQIVKQLFDPLFPLFALPDMLGIVAVPFRSNFLYSTPAFQQNFLNPELELINEDQDLLETYKLRTIQACCLILNRFYNANVELDLHDQIQIRNRTNGLEEYYRLDIDLRFVKIKALKPLKKISDNQIKELLNNSSDWEKWLEYIPPDHFSFYGFGIGYMVNITEEAIISAIKDLMVDNSGPPSRELLRVVERKFCSYLKMPELRIGITEVPDQEWKEFPALFSILKSDLSREEIFIDGSLYHNIATTSQPVIIDELHKEYDLKLPGKRLSAMGYKSLLLLPLIGASSKVAGILELATPRTFSFNTFHVQKMEVLRSLIAIALNRVLQQGESQINFIIQEHFTSIHPSVQWKFREVAGKAFLQKLNQKETSNIPDITFDNLHPLYGQADIIGSSTLRNKYIQEDLLENLKLLLKVLLFCSENVPYVLLKAYRRRCQDLIDRLKKVFISSDEVDVQNFLSEEAHPVLRQLSKKYPEQLSDMVEGYLSQLDNKLGIIYRQRRKYDESVEMLNLAILESLKAEDAKMQDIFPHYFEHFKTDGVEYNIYLGSSIEPKEDFSPHHLKNFRLWQLVHLCDLTRMVAGMQDEMPVPLTTAQLIFVYGSTLSIRFRMDEKKFDVDGAYNVRYEVVKKRIDKATIQGTNRERLTQNGKVAIVYLQEKDRREYLEYIQYLEAEGYITEEIEDLVLDRLQGAEGLRALRVTVKIRKKDT